MQQVVPMSKVLIFPTSVGQQYKLHLLQMSHVMALVTVLQLLQLQLHQQALMIMTGVMVTLLPAHHQQQIQFHLYVQALLA